MRILIVSPPKTGNVWVKNIFSNIYQLEILNKVPKNIDDLEKRIGQGWFKDGSIFHQHFARSDRLIDLIEAENIQLITTLRNPYDSFVSLYYFAQKNPKLYKDTDHPLAQIFGKPLDHPDVLTYIGKRQGGFGMQLVMAKNWIESGKSIIIRYEGLHQDAFSVLKTATDLIEPTSKQRILTAIEASRAQNMRKKNMMLRRHIRKATVGDWKNHLSEAHLAAFRDNHTNLLAKLGYPVE